jgi:hypothetical protein
MKSSNRDRLDLIIEQNMRLIKELMNELTKIERDKQLIYAYSLN